MGEFRDQERAVSEVFGFILLFSIVILSIGAVSIFGVNSLNEGRDAALMDNMERGFEGMASTIDDLEPGMSRSTSLRLGSGQLRIGEETWINVSVGGTKEIKNSVSPLLYTFDDERIIYVSSTVFRVSEESGVVVRPPAFELSQSGTIISVQNTIPSRAISIGGGTAQMRFTAQAPKNPTVDTGNSVEIDIDAPSEAQASLWESALVERLVRGGMSESTAESKCSRVGSKVECVYNVNSGEDTLVRSVVVSVELR